jgi:outer membrane lipopolysaccharide assembly protein LptE/RlpB
LRPLAKSSLYALLLTLIAGATGCGYHTAGHSTRLPQNINSIAVPAFENKTHTYRVEQVLTAAVLRELVTRTKYQIVPQNDNTADAVLRAEVLSTAAAPLTYDSSTGRASSEVVTLVVAVKLVGRDGRVLYENRNYTFRDKYQVSREITSFFDEQSPALQRIARDFASGLVSDLLEAF